MKIVNYLSLLFLLFISCKPVQKADIVISNINLIDVEEGKVINNQNVVIIDKLIVAIQNHDQQKYRTDQLINGEGKYLIPGLWDMHVHTGDADIFFPLYIANGITGVRDMGGGMEKSTGNLSVKFQKLAAWRNEVIQGIRPGPEMILAGSMIDGTPAAWPGSISVTDSISIHATIQAQKELGVDFIKVYHNLNMTQLREIAVAATGLKMKFAGHIPLSTPPFETLIEAAELGQSSIEHLINVQSAIVQSNEITPSYLGSARAGSEVIDNIDFDKERILYESFKENGTWLTTTVSIWWGIGQLDQPKNELYKKWLEFVPEHIMNEWNRNPFQDITVYKHPSEDYKTYRDASLGMARVAKRMHDAGVNIIAASDSENPGVVPGYGLHKELELLVQGGFSPEEVLKLVTLNPAKFLNRTDIGQISTGFRADLVILNKDPLKDITNTTLIDGVILNGEYFDRERLDSLLIHVKEELGKQ